MTLLTSIPSIFRALKPLGLDVAATVHRRRSALLQRAATNPFLLVFGEAYHPEWQATLNGGEPLPHVIVDGVVNGWIVPSLPDGGEIALTFAGQRYYVDRGGSFR